MISFPAHYQCLDWRQCQSPLPAHTDTLLHPGPSSSSTAELLTNRAVSFCHLQVAACGEQLCHQIPSLDFIHVGFLRKMVRFLTACLYSFCSSTKASLPGWREMELSVIRGIRKSTERILYHLIYLICFAADGNHPAHQKLALKKTPPHSDTSYIFPLWHEHQKSAIFAPLMHILFLLMMSEEDLFFLLTLQ